MSFKSVDIKLPLLPTIRKSFAHWINTSLKKKILYLSLYGNVSQGTLVIYHPTVVGKIQYWTL